MQMIEDGRLKDEMFKKVKLTIQKYELLKDGDIVLAGVSGGPDSVCMLHILWRLKNEAELKIEIHAAHVNHMIRFEESDADEEFVKQLCLSMKAVFHSERIDIPAIAESSKISHETAARIERYAFFDRIADSIGAARIAVAHNMNDQAETILMRLARGTGPEGLSGMSFKRGRIIRPLLSVKRAEIENYCLKNKLETKTDATNAINIYTRNALRNILIPEIDRVCGADFAEGAFRLAEILRDENDYLGSIAADAYCKCIAGPVDTNAADTNAAYKAAGEYNGDFVGDANKADDSSEIVCLSAEKLLALDKAIARRVVRLAVQKVRGDLVDIDSAHTLNALQLAERGTRNGKIIEFNSGIRAVRRYELICFENAVKQKKITKKEWKLAGVRIINVESCGYSLPEHDSRKMSVITLDMDKLVLSGLKDCISGSLPEGLEIRTRRENDIFRPFAGKMSKKLKKYMIEKKIPASLRDEIPLVAFGGEILCIAGGPDRIKTSECAAVTSDTRKILEIIITNEGND